jgi:hypothetical protein
LARAAVLFSSALDTTGVIKKTAYPGDAETVVQSAAALDRLNLIQPPLLRTNRLSAMPQAVAEQEQVAGSCETVMPVSEELYRASGWATLKKEGRPADCVLVAYQDSVSQEWIAVAISDSFEMQPDRAKHFRKFDQLWSRWSATIPRNAFPPGARLSFWAVNADEPKVYQLSDESSSKGP